MNNTEEERKQRQGSRKIVMKRAAFPVVTMKPKMKSVLIITKRKAVLKESVLFDGCSFPCLSNDEFIAKTSTSYRGKHNFSMFSRVQNEADPKSNLSCHRTGVRNS